MLDPVQDASQGLVGTVAGDKVAIQSAQLSANPQDIGDGLGKMIISAPGSPSEPVSSTSEKSDNAKVSNAIIAAANHHQPNDYPARADLRTEIYRPLPVVSLPVDGPSPDPSVICAKVLQALFEGLSDGNVDKVKNCFYDEQCYWRDQLALTYHFRTFRDKECISKALVERAAISKPGSVAVAPGTARLTSAGPTLIWIDCFFAFETCSPAASCSGMIQLLPPKDGEKDGQWKIWTLATWIDDFKGLEEDEARLKDKSARIDMETQADIDTDVEVLIVGAGNSGLCLAARFKAYGISYLAIDKFDTVGDNWAMRYDNMRFHVSKNFAQTPYLAYSDDTPEFLHRDDLAEQCKRLASTFGLNIWTSTTIKSTKQDEATKTWTVVLQTPKGERTIHAQQMVQATGVGSRFSYIPEVENEEAYKGISIHSESFKNGNVLKEKGVKSVTIVGSANTAFDVMQACYQAGLETTMIQRSPTYVYPCDYLKNPNGLGIYDILPVNVADSVVNAGPIAVGGQLMYGLHQMLAGAEPNRYEDLQKAGFQVDKAGDLMHNLLERAGGHYMDMGQTALLAEGKVAVKSGVTPVSFTANGMKLSDGTELASDAIIWCTGYADKNVRQVSPSIFGEAGEQLAAKMDATWQLDNEGEIRGLWKRQLNVDNFWIMGGFTSQHRYYSRFLAIQIKAALAGILPPAYRKVPDEV